MGGAPEPVLVVALALGLRTEPEGAAAVGFTAGLLQDLFGGGPLGLLATAKLWVGFAAGTLGRTVVLDSTWGPPVFVAAGTALSRALEAVLGSITSQPVPPLATWAQGTLVAAWWNALTAPLVFAGLRKVGNWRARPARARQSEP
ncbi:MAG: rod shape-determining protein MreD [Armatimonadetes bacterium]|nr:rod shape-determining protein MreD [Armatimonadota bacterium]